MGHIQTSIFGWPKVIWDIYALQRGNSFLYCSLPNIRAEGRLLSCPYLKLLPRIASHCFLTVVDAKSGQCQYLIYQFNPTQPSLRLDALHRDSDCIHKLPRLDRAGLPSAYCIPVQRLANILLHSHFKKFWNHGAGSIELQIIVISYITWLRIHLKRNFHVHVFCYSKHCFVISKIIFGNEFCTRRNYNRL